jgi:hypothetical protein
MRSLGQRDTKRKNGSCSPAQQSVSGYMNV